MIIGIWLGIIICFIIVLGEIQYRHFDKKERHQSKEIARDWEDDMDIDMDELSVESVNGGFVSSQSLAMRGSWRLAQNQIMGSQTFDAMRAEEYNKML